MKYVVAVSGGVDSVVLLNMFFQLYGKNIIVAHFDHGIRLESDADARFVRGLANEYDVTFESSREELGSYASEELARTRRYNFLRSVAKKYEAALVTAHHLDDLVETVAINLTRGTGWRGLAVFGDATIIRPLLKYTKAELISYAVKHKLEWVEDETNATGAYLRNNIRKKLSRLPAASKYKIAQLYQQQHNLKNQIIKQSSSYIEVRNRYFFIMVPQIVALELLRQITHAQLVTSQLENLLLAIKTAKPGSFITAGAGVVVRFNKSEFIIESTGKML